MNIVDLYTHSNTKTLFEKTIDEWNLSMQRSRSLSILNSKTDIITPIELVEEIILKIISGNHPSQIMTWHWLDPCAGRGTFGYVIFRILFKFLKDEIPDDIIRKKHILDHIHLVEINKSAYNNLTKDFVNVLNENSLGYKFKMKFDVIIGNPPYQPFSKKDSGKGNGSRNKIWHKFIEIGFINLKQNGIMSMITPNNWRTGNFTNGVHKNAQKLIWNSSIIEFGDAKKYFPKIGYSINIDYWIIKNDNLASINIALPKEYKKFMLIPKSIDNDTVLSFFKAIESEDEIIINMDINLHDRRKYSCIRSEKGDNIHKYPHLNSFAQFKDNLRDWYDQKTDGFNNKKVIIFDSGNIGPIYDKNGDFGTGSGAYAYTVTNDEDASFIIKFFQSSEYNKIKSNFTQENALRNPNYLFRKLPKKWIQNNIK